MKQMIFSSIARLLAIQLLLVFACITVMQFAYTTGTFSKHEIRKPVPVRDASVQALLEERDMDEEYQTVPILAASLFLLQNVKFGLNVKRVLTLAQEQELLTSRLDLFLKYRVLRL